MKNAFNAIRGAVASKEFVPLLTHVHIYEGRIQATNLRTTLDAPFPDAKLSATVPAALFGKALNTLSEGFEITFTEQNMIMKDTSTSIKLPLADGNEFPKRCFKDKKATFRGTCKGLIKSLEVLVPFVGVDASRPWSCGVWFKDNYAFATNNVCVVKTPTEEMPELVIPFEAVETLLSRKIDPTHVAVFGNSVTFSYADGSWLNSALIEDKWPDVTRFFSDEATEKVPKGLKEIVIKIAQFVPDASSPTLIFDESGVKTLASDRGAIDKTVTFKNTSSFRADHMIRVLEKATHLDFSAYPNPSPFKGDNCLGMIVGVR